MDEATQPLPDAIEDEYSLDPPIETTRPWMRMRKVQYVEPVMFLTMMAISISLSIQSNTIELQYCKAVLDIDDSSKCLNTTSSYFKDVQKYTSTFGMYQTIYDSIFPIIFSIFVGPWSDIFGRRPVMISSSIGTLITSVLWVWGSTTRLHPDYFLLFNLPLSLSGGTIMIISTMFCYVCDTTTLDDRAYRLGILQGFIHIGTLVGSIATPYLIKIGYTFAYAIGAYASAIRLLYVLLLLKESVNVTEQASASKNPFQWHYVKSLYESCYAKQSSHTFQLLIYIALLVFVSLTQMFGESTVFYLFLQKVLGWTINEYTPLSCNAIIASAFAAFVGTWYFSKVLGFADLEIINFANGCRLLGSLVLAFGHHIWFIYLASVLNSAYGLAGGMVRVLLSRIVHAEDLGKVFALCGTLDLITPLIGSLLYSSVYNATIDTYPNAIFVVSSFLCLLLTLLTAKIVNLFQNRSSGFILSPNLASINE